MNKDNTKEDGQYSEVEQKLLLLHLLYKLDMPLSHTHISNFALKSNYMNYFSLQNCLAEMLSTNFIEKNNDGNITRYSITDEGIKTLEIFDQHLPEIIIINIEKYINDNKSTIYSEHEIKAFYTFNTETEEYDVICGVYEDNKALMELKLSLVSLEQAKFVCKNWKVNSTSIYSGVMSELTNSTRK